MHYLTATFELLVQLLLRSNWQMQWVIIQSVNDILKKSENISSTDIVPLLSPIVNLGPRVKSTNLKRDVLNFLKILLDHRRYTSVFHSNESLKELLRFNLEEMIHDTRSSEISDQAKDLKRKFEEFFQEDPSS